MDKLTKAALQHGEIFEASQVFKESVSASSLEDIKASLQKTRDFFEGRIIDHFKFEEEEIFPSLLDVSTQEEKQLIRRLEQEHTIILDKIDYFKDLSTTYTTHLDAHQVDTFLRVRQEILKMLLDHARAEDTQLFPLLKKYNLNIE